MLAIKRAALALTRKLHWELVRAGGPEIQWVSIDLIVERPMDADALAYAVEHDWIAVASGRDRVMLTENGRRQIK
jgi:hypothetical protein